MPEDNEKNQPPVEQDAPKDPFEAADSQTPDSGMSQQSAPTHPDTESKTSTPEPVPPATPEPNTSSQQTVAPATNQAADGFMASGPGIGPETPGTTVTPDTTIAPAAQGVPQASPLFGGTAASGTPNDSIPSGQKSKKKWLLPVLIGGGIVLLAVALFGFKTYTSSPDYVWNKSIENTQKAYQTLDTQLQKSAEFKGSTTTGTLSFTADNTEIGGDFKAKSAGESSDVALDLSFSNGNGSGSAVKISAGLDMRVIAGNSDYPDIYIRARDLDKVARLLGTMGMSSSEINAMVSEYNNQWYVLEGSYLQRFSSVASGGTSVTQGMTAPNAPEIYKLVSKIGKVSSEYIFSTDDGKAVLVQKDFIGKEDKNGRATYHYKAAVNKTGLRAYGQALKKTLTEDATARTLMSAKDQTEAEKALAYLDDLSKNYKDNKVSVDIWVDSGTKLVQTVRLSDSKDSKSYMELSQLYDSSDKLPLQLIMNSASGKVTAKVTVDTKKNENTYDVKAVGDSGNLSFTATESFTNTAPTIEKPSGAKSVEQLLNAYTSALTQKQAQNQLLMQQYMSKTQLRTN